MSGSSPRKIINEKVKTKLLDAERLQQELGSKIASMSMDEARAAIFAAQKVLDDLKRDQAEAIKAAEAASRDATEARIAAGMPPVAPKPLVTHSSKNATSNSSQNQKQNANTVKRTEAEIMSEVQQLLRESNNARAEMASARDMCDLKVKESRKAIADLNEANKEKDRLSAKLESRTEVMASALKEEQENMASDILPIPPHSQTPTQPDLSLALAPVHEQVQKAVQCTPSVKLSFAQDSAVACGGKVNVCFELSKGDWHEDDALVLRAVPAPGSGSERIQQTKQPQSLYLSSEVEGKNAFDAMEYTDQPVKGKGSVAMTLPEGACHMSVEYVRTTTAVVGEVGTQSVLRTETVLAALPVFALTGGIHLANPLSRSHAKGNGNGTMASAPRRRGAGTCPQSSKDCPSELTLLLEHQKNIHTFTLWVNAEYPHPTALSRVVGWGMPSTEAEAEESVHVRVNGGRGGMNAVLSGTKLMLEVDVCHYPYPTSDGQAEEQEPQPEVVCADRVSTVMLVVHLPLPPEQLEWARTQLEVDNNGRVSVRIPYLPAVVDRARSQQPITLPIPAPVTSGGKDDVGIECLFCGNELVPAACITSTQTLPSGLFDNIMHEFVCSEDITALTLTTADMSTPRGALLEGPVHITLNPSDLQVGAVNVSCKEAPTMVDLFSGQGSALASAPVPEGSTAGKGSTASVINIDTCVLHCARCLVYVGDGQLASDADDCACPIHDLTSTVETETGQESQQLEISDLRDVRFARNSVTVPTRLLQAPALGYPHALLVPTPQDGSFLVAEQALARTTVHLMGALGVASFVVSTPVPMSEVPTTPQKQLDVSAVILIRLISKEYGVTEPICNQSHGLYAHCFPAIKVSFRCGSRAELAKDKAFAGTETRIPMLVDDLVAVTALLERRSKAYGPSFFKKQKVAYLLL